MTEFITKLIKFLQEFLSGTKKTITRDVIADKIIEIISRDVNAGLRETNGKNRSLRIDSFNKRVGVELGSPYCASAAWCAYDDACKELGLKNPIKPTAASQDFRKPSFVNAKYISVTCGLKGSSATLQNVDDSSHGHHVTLTHNQRGETFKTAEYNTDGSGSRDGDGAYFRTRSTIDKSDLNAGKLFICFTDIPQWILDFNNKG